MDMSPFHVPPHSSSLWASVLACKQRRTMMLTRADRNLRRAIKRLAAVMRTPDSRTPKLVLNSAPASVDGVWT